MTSREETALFTGLTRAMEVCKPEENKKISAGLPSTAGLLQPVLTQTFTKGPLENLVKYSRSVATIMTNQCDESVIENPFGVPGINPRHMARVVGRAAIPRPD